MTPSQKQSSAQLIRFGFIGLLNTAFSYGIYAVGLYVGLQFYTASFFALIIGIFVSFFTQGRLVFKSQLKDRFGLYVIMWTFLYFLNIGLIKLLELCGIDNYFAGLIAILPVVTISYTLQKFFVFKSSS